MVMVVALQRLVQREMLLHHCRSQSIGRFNDVEALVGLAVVGISDDRVRKRLLQRGDTTQIGMAIRRRILENAVAEHEGLIIDAFDCLHRRLHLAQIPRTY